MSGFALLLLECPWATPGENPMRMSALPFFQALERVEDEFNVYYSTFYDIAGFRAALAYDLLDVSENTRFLYIGAHGNRSAIANGRASTLLESVPKGITGVVLSSCEVGTRDRNFANAFRGNDLRWVFAYTKPVEWVFSQQLEISIIDHLQNCYDSDFNDSGDVVALFSAAMGRFNPNALIGLNERNYPTYPLRDSIRLLWRPHRAHGPRDLTEEVLESAWVDNSLDDLD